MAGLFIDDTAETADLFSLTAVMLVGCHELDPAVAVPVALQGLDVDHLRGVNAVLDGLKLVPNRLQLSPLVGFQYVLVQDLEALGDR